MILLRILLFPFAILYSLITSVRNYLYDRQLKPSAAFDVPVINVGNLSVGGTGKSPMIEHLIRLLAPDYKVATLSRGYGRKTKGFRIAGAADHAETIGDEPFQFHRKYGDIVRVTVGEERAFAIPNIIHEHEDTDVILLDDAYQHRQVTPSLNILLSDYNNPFYNDFLLPSGRLRESRTGARRADVIVVTKCPEGLSGETMIKIEHAVRNYAGMKPVFFTNIHYGAALPLGNEATLSQDIILLTGIAQPAPFRSMVETTGRVVTHVNFPDHHQYTSADLVKLQALLQAHPDASILTTEKDMVKLIDTKFAVMIKHLPIFYVPIEVAFLKNGQDFDAMILNAVQKNSQFI